MCHANTLSRKEHLLGASDRINVTLPPQEVCNGKEITLPGDKMRYIVVVLKCLYCFLQGYPAVIQWRYQSQARIDHLTSKLNTMFSIQKRHRTHKLSQQCPGVQPRVISFGEIGEDHPATDCPSLVIIISSNVMSQYLTPIR